MFGVFDHWGVWNRGARQAIGPTKVWEISGDVWHRWEIRASSWLYIKVISQHGHDISPRCPWIGELI